MKNLWSEWARLSRRIASFKRKLLFLDFDGTLAPIAKTPAAVFLPEKARLMVWTIARCEGYRVALLSGRPVSGLKKYLRFPGLWYIGNHGLEIEGRGLRLPSEARRARQSRFFMKTLAQKFKVDFRYLPGALVEDKGWTVSLHFRNVSREDQPAFQEAVKFYRERFRSFPVAWRKGKKVWAIYPRVPWDKGRAALHVLKSFPGALPIALGDDHSDEDAFRALARRGLTIRIGRSKQTQARYYLPSQKDVATFLEALCQTSSRLSSKRS